MRDYLAYEKKIRTYSKRLVTALSIVLGIGYTATLFFQISGLSLYFPIASLALSTASLMLNIWSLNGYFQRQEIDKKSGVQEKNSFKLAKICLNIISSTSFLSGGIISMLPFKTPNICFITTPFFIFGYVITAANLVMSIGSALEVGELNNLDTSLTI